MSHQKGEQRTIAFLKMAAIELRRIAARAPAVAIDLRHISQQIETETADMEQRGNSSPVSYGIAKRKAPPSPEGPKLVVGKRN